MKVSARRGRLRLRFESVEVELLDGLLAELAELVAADGADPAGVASPAGTDDPVLARLFPDGYADDPAAAADFRSLTAGSLREERAERIAACVRDLADGPDVDLTVPADADRWIRVLNDLRLALGTRLGVTDDDHDVDPDDQPRLVYHWLTAVQDGLVTALTP